MRSSLERSDCDYRYFCVDGLGILMIVKVDYLDRFILSVYGCSTLLTKRKSRNSTHNLWSRVWPLRKSVRKAICSRWPRHVPNCSLGFSIGCDKFYKKLYCFHNESSAGVRARALAFRSSTDPIKLRGKGYFSFEPSQIIVALTFWTRWLKNKQHKIKKPPLRNRLFTTLKCFLQTYSQFRKHSLVLYS